MWKKRRLLIVNAALVAVLLVIGVGAYLLLFRGDGGTKAGNVRTVAVQRGTVEESVSASGTVDPAHSANVDFATSGTVEKLNVSEGDSVSKGDVLARLDDTAAQQALTAAQSKLTAAQDSLDEAEAKDVCDDNTTTGGQGSCVTQSQLSSARAEVDAAQASVSAAEADVAATKLKAPMSGRVIAINGTVGSSATGSGGSGSGSDGSGSGGSGSSDGSGGQGSDDSSSSSGSLDTSSGFVVIAGLDDLVVNASVAEADASKLKKSAKATLTFPALPAKKAQGTVTSVDLAPSTSSGVVKYGVRIDLSDQPSGLRIGQTADITVVTDTANNVLYLPTVAVHGSGSQATVTVMKNGKQSTKTVTTGLKGDTYTEIRSGLEEGDKVVLATATQQTGGGNGGGAGQQPVKIGPGGGSGGRNGGNGRNGGGGGKP